MFLRLDTADKSCSKLIHHVQLREERAAEFKRAMEDHQRQLKRIRDEDASDSSDSYPEGDNGSDQEWEGFTDPPAVDYEAEYIDEDKYTTVTVEEMDASREGLRKSVQDADTDSGDEDGDKQTATATAAEAQSKPKRKSWVAGAEKPRKKKKQFRYETKQDRKLAQVKLRLSKAKKAKARRER